ncbi:hypothetical protein [Salinimicrobium sp. GXAS 041]|uniref:hypothetical protein n=1 Tax=Salinimicrobium sp. GXAS 041 TaxID=3400806 RepID=UPI003C725B94
MAWILSWKMLPALFNGKIKAKKPSGKLKSFVFCEIYESQSTTTKKIKEIALYVMSLK